MTDPTELRATVEGVRWYHSIELPGGIVTPGEYDLRSSVDRLPLPGSLTGMRCLDVGTHDGFWAFEMERRAAAEVVAIDVDDPTRLDLPGPPREIDEETRDSLARRRTAFSIAHAALGSKVDRRDLSVYDLMPEEVGHFDLAFIGTLLHHLRDPVGALAAIRQVVRGGLVVSAVFSISKTLLHPRQPVAELLMQGSPFWEIPNLVGISRQLTAAGWEVERVSRPFLQRYGAGWRPRPVDLRPSGWRLLPRRLVLHYGAPHVGLFARPA